MRFASQRIEALHALPSVPQGVPHAIRRALLADLTITVSELLSLPHHQPQQPRQDSAKPLSTAPTFSEHVIKALCDVLTDAIPPAAPSFHTSATRELNLAIAHLFHLFLSLLHCERALFVRIALLDALLALARLCSPSLLAAFLPGVASSLCAFLRNAASSHSSLTPRALQLLSVFLPVLNVHHSSPVVASPSSQTSFSDALRRRRAPTEAPCRTHQPSDLPDASRSLLVTRDSAWLDATVPALTAQLLRIVHTPAGPLSHSSPACRVAFAIFARDCLYIPPLFEVVRLRNALILSLLTLRADRFDDVSSQTNSIVSQLVPTRELLNVFLHAFRALANNSHPARVCPEDDVVQRFVSFDEQRLQKCLHAVFVLLFPPNASQPLLEQRRLPSFITSLGPNTFANMLCGLFRRLYVYPAIPPDPHHVRQSCRNVACEAAFRAGHTSCMYTLMPQLLVLAEEAAKFEDKAHCALLLCALMRGALVSARDPDVLRLVGELFELLNHFLVPAFDYSDAQSEHASDAVIALKVCLLSSFCDVLEQCAHFCQQSKRPLPTSLVLVCLISLLCDVAHGELIVRPFAATALELVARVVGCSSVRNLLHRHLNFVVSRVLARLDERWATDVLAFIVEKPDEVNRIATGMVQRSLTRLCDSLAGVTDQRALQVLPAVHAVLSTALTQMGGKNQFEERRRAALDSVETNRSLSETDRVELRRTLFQYCREEVVNYAELTTVSSEQAGEYDDVSKDDGENQNAFERLAQDTLTAMRDLLVGRSWKLRTEALSCATLAVKLLGHRRKLLLPHAAKLLPLLPDQFMLLDDAELTAGDRMLKAFKKKKLRGRMDAQRVEDLVEGLNKKSRELPIVSNACELLAALAHCAGSFIQDRFIRLIYPKLIPLLRLAQFYPTLLASTVTDVSNSLVTPPSYGAMTASDACLEMLASISLATPSVVSTYALSLIKYLVVFFDQRNDPLRSPHRKIVHVNRSMVRYESERWIRREQWADVIVRQLKKINPEDVLVGLLSYDHTAPTVIKPRSAGLHPINVSALRPQ